MVQLIEMSKVSKYLNEHLQGEVTVRQAIRREFSHDASILKVAPEMVIYPRLTSDIRKVARFSYQLAEKGHKLSITPRGAGSDQTGGAVGSGIILNFTAHMDAILEVDAKQRLVRLQPGVTFKTLNQALRLHGLWVPAYPRSHAYSTIGGAIANNSSGVFSGKYGSIFQYVKQLEVVLSNGEVLQTGRLSKRELNKIKGEQSFEGEVYRNIDNLINDNDEALDKLAIDVRDNIGYNLVDVKRRDGSIDLTPLFIGSQGTLGIVSEVILQAEPIPQQPLVGAVAFASMNDTRDALDFLGQLNPAVLEVIDARVVERAVQNGYKYDFYTEATQNDNKIEAIVVMEFDDDSGRAKKKIAKKIEKYFKESSAYVVLEQDDSKTIDIRLLENLPALATIPENGGLTEFGALSGVYVAPDQLEAFMNAIQELEKKYKVELPLVGHATQGVYEARVQLDMTKPADRQKALKLVAEWAVMVYAHGGHMIGEAGEGRLKSIFAYKEVGKEITQLYSAVRDIFDPLGTMNTGVKQVVEASKYADALKKLVDGIRTDYDGTDFVNYVEGD